MIQHLPDLTRPETEIERIIRDIPRRQPEDLPQPARPVQVPGFRNPNDPRIPAALRQMAIARARQNTQRRKGQRSR